MTKLAKAVEAFNAAHPVGTVVEYRKHPTAEPLTSITRSEAWVLEEHTAVVLVEAVSGCVALDALRIVGVVP